MTGTYDGPRMSEVTTLSRPKTTNRVRSGPCVFCKQERPFTQEHVIPRWVRKILKTGPVEISWRSTGKRIAYDQTLTLPRH